MSLTKNIQYNDSWKLFFKENVPKKKEFQTLSGNAAFSNKYTEHIKYKLSDSNDAGVVGTAFDYLARWTVAKVSEINRNLAYEDLIAEYGVEVCLYAAERENIDIQSLYDKALNKCKEYIKGDIDKKEIINVAVFFAKLEQLMRRNASPYSVDIYYILECKDEVVEELDKLYELFVEKFIANGIVMTNSTVVYNPIFGGASVLCGGADADIYIDGTLYDFKCTKRPGYNWTDVAQLLGYYLLDNVAKINNDGDNDLKDYEIKRIAFYKARFGEVEFIDIQKEKYLDLIKSFENLLGKDDYQEYLEEEKQDINKENIVEMYINSKVKNIMEPLLRERNIEFSFIKNNDNYILEYSKKDKSVVSEIFEKSLLIILQELNN